MLNNFTNKVILITGGTSGMGEAIVKKYVSEGATVFFIGRNLERGNGLVSSIRLKYPTSDVFFIKYDLANLKSIDMIRRYIQSKGYAGIDVLVNVAGIWKTAALDDVTIDAYREVFDINFAAPMFLIKEMYSMIKNNKGNIINVCSIGGLQSHIAGSKQYLYAASKAAMIQFSQLCSLNFAPDVRVNCICPGITDTPIFENRDFSRFSNIPLKKIGRPEGVADLVYFVSSDAASYMTGAVITLDGGGSLL